MLACRRKSVFVRVVTIKTPPVALEDAQADNVNVGRILEVPAKIGLLMIAAGWVRSDTRSRIRRQRDGAAPLNRRGESDRRSDSA